MFSHFAFKIIKSKSCSHIALQPSVEQSPPRGAGLVDLISGLFKEKKDLQTLQAIQETVEVLNELNEKIVKNLALWAISDFDFPDGVQFLLTWTNLRAKVGRNALLKAAYHADRADTVRILFEKDPRLIDSARRLKMLFTARSGGKSAELVAVLENAFERR